MRWLCAVLCLLGAAGAQADLKSKSPREMNPFHLRSAFVDADENQLTVVAPTTAGTLLLEPVIKVEAPPRTFNWTGAGNQTFYFLSIQHGLRMVQRKTRREMDGGFFHDYANAVSGLGGWGDTDSVLTNYVGHPMMGAISGYIQIQNDPKGALLAFDSRNSAYWRSRLKAFGWAALYSTQFELGPFSEAAIGNVGRKRGTMGYVDLVMTPIGGFGWIVSEDAIDKHFVQKWEAGRSDGMKRFLRIFFNPNRSFANALRLKKPWHRDTRTMAWDRP